VKHPKKNPRLAKPITQTMWCVKDIDCGFIYGTISETKAEAAEVYRIGGYEASNSSVVRVRITEIPRKARSTPRTGKGRAK